MLSVIIPSRQPEYLQQTVDGLLNNAEGEVEIIIIFDGIWPDALLKPDKRIVYMHQGTQHNNQGMRYAINNGVAVARGDYIMKIDEHCIVDKGYDVKLIADCEDDWCVIPRRYRVDWEKWQVLEDGRPPVDYMILDYPYQRPNDITCGLHGSEHREEYWKKKDILIDDVMTCQGSCYFMPKKLWERVIGKMDEDVYGPFTQEAQEICNKVWFSGGRVVVNKKTWYAHMHKGKRGKGYGFSNAQYKVHQKEMNKGRLYCIDYWMNTKDYPRDFDWLMAKFWPVPGWPENWKEQVIIDKAKENDTTY